MGNRAMSKVFLFWMGFFFRRCFLFSLFSVGTSVCIKLISSMSIFRASFLHHIIDTDSMKGHAAQIFKSGNSQRCYNVFNIQT